MSKFGSKTVPNHNLTCSRWPPRHSRTWEDLLCQEMFIKVLLLRESRRRRATYCSGLAELGTDRLLALINLLRQLRSHHNQIPCCTIRHLCCTIRPLLHNQKLYLTIRHLISQSDTFIAQPDTLLHNQTLLHN